MEYYSHVINGGLKKRTGEEDERVVAHLCERCCGAWAHTARVRHRRGVHGTRRTGYATTSVYTTLGLCLKLFQHVIYAISSANLRERRVGLCPSLRRTLFLFR